MLKCAFLLPWLRAIFLCSLRLVHAKPQISLLGLLNNSTVHCQKGYFEILLLSLLTIDQGVATSTIVPLLYWYSSRFVDSPLLVYAIFDANMKQIGQLLCPPPRSFLTFSSCRPPVPSLPVAPRWCFSSCRIKNRESRSRSTVSTRIPS